MKAEWLDLLNALYVNALKRGGHLKRPLLTS
ncbi:hypothetical protein H4CHR_01562 [Variovorax sp. PBS-H4]|nr:hypothetical protein H4CHR_01562 [Variovorax sp. PBS-H4]